MSLSLGPLLKSLLKASINIEMFIERFTSFTALV